MTKQEEIRERVITLCCVAKVKDWLKSPTGFDDEVDEFLSDLSDMGVVIKVDGELPPLGNARVMFEPEDVTEWYRRGAQDYLQKVITAGFRFFEPLVDTGQKQGV